MILGDNIFFGGGLSRLLQKVSSKFDTSTVFGYHVSEPERYGVVDYDSKGRVRGLIEKPKIAPSNIALTGLYFLDHTAPERAKKIRPSERGELEITSLLEMYLSEGKLMVEELNRGFAWLDTGTHSSLLEAGNFVRTIAERQNLQVGSPDEVAYKLNWVSKEDLIKRARLFDDTSYGQHLSSIIED